MFQRTFAVVLVSVLVMGFSYGSRDEKKTTTAPAASTASKQVQNEAAAVYDTARSQAAAAKSEVKQTVDAYSKNFSSTTPSESKPAQPAYNAMMTAAPAAAAPAVAAAPASGQFPTKLISQLASGDEATRKARMESLKRLSIALSQMNAQKQAQPASAPVKSDTSKKA